MRFSLFQVGIFLVHFTLLFFGINKLETVVNLAVQTRKKHTKKCGPNCKQQSGKIVLRADY